jgi:hypothetical protein
MDIRQGMQEWYAASELVIVLVAIVFSVVLVANQDALSAFRAPISSAVPRDIHHPSLEVIGMGSAAPTGSSNALQSASPLQQAGETGKNLQRSGADDKELQPNTGQSTFSNQKSPF